MAIRTELVKWVVLTVLSAGFADAQQRGGPPAGSTGNVVICGGGVTTNCYLKVDGSGNIALPGNLTLGTTLPAAEIASLGNLVAWGDSLTAGVNGIAWPTQLASLAGTNVAINAYSGWTSTQVATLFAQDTSRLHWLNVFWVGRNNYTQTSTILSDIAGMVAKLPPGSRFIVLNPINYWGSQDEWNTGKDYHYFSDVSAALAAAYPNNYIDVRAVLVAAYNPADPNDIIDHGHDTPPRSLQTAGVHLSTAGYRIVAQQVNSWMQSHGGQYVPNFTTLNQAIYHNAALWMRNPQTVSSLANWCGPNTVGFRRMVSDATVTTPGTLAVGGGNYTIAVQCVYNKAGYLFFLNID